jgi:predicted PurR-regulated permease PerM
MTSDNKFYFIIMAFIMLVLGYLTYQIISPFLSSIMWAIVLSILFNPVYTFIHKYVKYKSAASLLTLIIILIILFGPFSYLSYLIAQEAMSLMGSIESGSLDSLKTLLKHPAANTMIKKVLLLFHVTEHEFQKALIENLTKIGKESTGLIQAGLGNIVTGIINFVFMILSTFFFLGDGPEFIEKISNFMPFSKKQKDRLLRQTKNIIVSTMYGGVTVAAAQGIIGGILFAALGIPSAVLWGLTMFMASFIPMVGTFIIWGPAAGYLFFEGLYLKGTIMVLAGVFAISSADNILRPLIMKGKTKMPVLAIFFSILGGIKLFGFIGLIVGPLVFALFVSVFEIFSYSENQTEEQKAD